MNFVGGFLGHSQKKNTKKCLRQSTKKSVLCILLNNATTAMVGPKGMALKFETD